MPNYMNITSMIAVEMEGTYSFKLQELEEKIDVDINTKNNDGYKVKAITPITGSSYSNITHESYGQSFTVAVLIVYEKIKNKN